MGSDDAERVHGRRCGAVRRGLRLNRYARSAWANARRARGTRRRRSGPGVRHRHGPGGAAARCARGAGQRDRAQRGHGRRAATKAPWPRPARGHRRHGDDDGGRHVQPRLPRLHTLSNLLEQDEQVGCFANAAHHLAPGGAFMVEQGEPDLRRFPPGAVAVPFEIGDDHLGFDTYDLVKQQLTSHHYRAGQRPHRLGVDLRQDGLTGRAPQDSYVSERGWSRRCSCTIHRSEQLGAETSAASPVGSVFSHAATAWAFSSRPMSHVVTA